MPPDRPQHRDRLERELCRLSYEQLDALVRAALGRSLEHFSLAGDLPTVVFAMLNELEQNDDERFQFLAVIHRATREPGLRFAIDRYIGLPSPTSDPYEALVVYDEPFVNRVDLREALKVLFAQDQRRVLLTRGPRYSGRSHSRWLIQHVAESHQAIVEYVDLLPPGGEAVTIGDVIAQIASVMQLSPNDVRDRVAQASTQAAGFVYALRGHVKAQVHETRHWCLIFDHFDRREVAPETSELVERLIEAAAQHQLPDLRIIVLGFDEEGLTNRIGYRNIQHRLEHESIHPLTQEEVKTYLRELAQESGNSLSDQQLESIVQNFPLPISTQDDAWEFRDRLRQHMSSIH